MTREEYLKMLRENEELKSIFSKAPSGNEKRAIKAYTEDFAMKFYENIFDPIMKALEKDPEALNKALSELENELIREETETQENK